MPGRLSRHMRFAAALLALSSVAVAATPETALMNAAKAGDAAAVRALLRKADVNAAESNGTTALHWAVHFDHAAVVDLLIEAGAKVRVPNRYKMTPLALAAINGNAPIIERLLAAGADANDAIADGETALMTAARADRTDAVKVLLAHGARVNARESFRGQTALMWAAARANVAMVKLLLEAGAEINAKTPTVLRADPNEVYDFRDTIKIGGQSGWQQQLPDPSAFSALLFAVRAGHTDVVRVLLDNGANVNDVLSDGTSALMIAISNAHFELAAYLLDRGANPSANDPGWTALHQLIRDRRTNTRTFNEPVVTGNLTSLDLIVKLLDSGANINARAWNNRMNRKDSQRDRFNYMGATPFLVAAKIGDLQVMQLLFARGANPRTANVEGETALMVAAGVALFNPGEDAGSSPEHMAERLAAVKYCVETHGLKLNARSKDNETALHGAVYLGYIPIVEYLVQKGAELDVKNDRGWTPLMIANGVAWAEFYKEYPEVAAVLRRVMTQRGLATENQIGDQVTCKDCFTTRGEEAYRRMMHERALQDDAGLVAALKSAK